MEVHLLTAEEDLDHVAEVELPVESRQMIATTAAMEKRVEGKCRIVSLRRVSDHRVISWFALTHEKRHAEPH